MTAAQDSRALWINPNDKTQNRWLPNIGERVLFKHAGRVYLGKHTGGSFKAEYPLGKTFDTWDCQWMYPDALDAQPVARTPLSDEQIDSLWGGAKDISVPQRVNRRAIARSIESAHGITQEKRAA